MFGSQTTPFNGILAVMMSILVLMMIVSYICWRLTQKSFIWIFDSIDSLIPNRNHNRRVYFIRCETCCKCSQNANNDCIQFWSVIVIIHAASKCRQMNICSVRNGEDFPTVEWKRRICFFGFVLNFYLIFLFCFFYVPKRRLIIEMRNKFTQCNVPSLKRIFFLNFDPFSKSTIPICLIIYSFINIKIFVSF